MTEGPTADVHESAFDVRDAVLVVSSAAGVQVVPLPRKPRFVVGRATTCDVVVEDPSVSREHAALFVLGGQLRIEDLGSRNKTKVGGRALFAGQTAVVELGAAVEVGTASMFLQRRLPEATAPAAAPRATDAVVLDPTMQSLHGLLGVVAPSPLSVLVFGETGTGKEVFAEAIHARSARARGPMLRVNCAGLAGSLLESELFGHEKGAFTGALAAKPGLFEAADGGTLFLDEIGEMPVDTQAKLLRVLETGEVTRLGSVKPRNVDVRYVAATHRDLQAMIADGRFRADLFFRLNGFSLTLPPLRKRPSELVPLARLFLARAAAGRPGTLSPAAEAALVAHTWPGNVRELKNVVERALVLAGASGVIEPEHLHLDAPSSSPVPSSISIPAAVPSGPLSGSPFAASASASADLRARRDAWEKQTIEDVLTRTGWSQKEAAAVLGFTVRTLQNKISQLGIERPKKSKR